MDNKTTKSIGLIRIRIAALFIENDKIRRMRISPMIFDMCLFKTPALFVENDKMHRTRIERWGAGVETHKNVRGEIRGWGRVPFNEPYAPSLSTIYDGA